MPKKVKCVDCGKLFDPDIEGIEQTTQLVDVVRNGCVDGTREKQVWLCDACYWQDEEET